MKTKFVTPFLALAIAFAGLTSTAPVAHATDVAITAANVLPSGTAQLTTEIAGATITAGQIVYKDGTGKIQLSKANAAAPGNSVYGIAVTGGFLNGKILVCTYDTALAIGGTVPAGTMIWLSVLNAGGVNSTPADDVAGGTMTRIVLGVGTGPSGTVFFRPTAGGILP